MATIVRLAPLRSDPERFTFPKYIVLILVFLRSAWSIDALEIIIPSRLADLNLARCMTTPFKFIDFKLAPVRSAKEKSASFAFKSLSLVSWK